jgi:hypothetical protein
MKLAYPFKFKHVEEMDGIVYQATQHEHDYDKCIVVFGNNNKVTYAKEDVENFVYERIWIKQ